MEDKLNVIKTTNAANLVEEMPNVKIIVVLIMAMEIVLRIQMVIYLTVIEKETIATSSDPKNTIGNDVVRMVTTWAIEILILIVVW